MFAVIGLIVTIWFFFSSAIWWVLAVAALMIMMYIGEDKIFEWIFFISVISGIAWLFFKYVYGIEL
jgi:hypothetical protein